MLKIEQIRHLLCLPGCVPVCLLTYAPACLPVRPRRAAVQDQGGLAGARVLPATHQRRLPPCKELTCGLQQGERRERVARDQVTW